MMTFNDNAGRSWTVAMNVWALKRVRDSLGVDLLDLGDADGKPEDQLLYRLVADPVLLVDVLYVACKPEADERQVGDEDFGKAMAGDAIDHATKALLEEIADFIPNPRDRARARKVIEATWTMIDRAQDVLDGRVDADLEKGMAEALATLGGGSTSLPASSE